MSKFTVGAKVRYTSPHTSRAAAARAGKGLITKIRETRRGLWYEVQDLATKATISLRESGLAVAR